MEMTFASREVLDFIGLDGCFFRTDGGITRLVHPLQVSVRNMLVLSGTPLEPQGSIVLRLKPGDELSVPVHTEGAAGEKGVFLVSFGELLPERLARKVLEVSRTLRRTGRRSEGRYDIGIAGADRFGLLSPVVELTDGAQRVKCIISNASLHGALLTGDRSHLSSGTPVLLKCRFRGERHAVAQKSVVMNIGRAQASSSHFFYSLHFVDPVSFIWTLHLQSFADGAS